MRGRRTIVDDETGAIVYAPSFIEPPTARRWFASLREGVDWQSERRRMYDRDVDVPRLVARYALDDEHLPEALARGGGSCGARYGSAVQ